MFLYAGQPREFEGPRAKYVVTALIEYLTVLLEYIDLLKQSGAQGKMPQLPPPPLGGPACIHFLSN